MSQQETQDPENGAISNADVELLARFLASLNPNLTAPQAAAMIREDLGMDAVAISDSAIIVAGEIVRDVQVFMGARHTHAAEVLRRVRKAEEG